MRVRRSGGFPTSTLTELGRFSWPRCDFDWDGAHYSRGSLVSDGQMLIATNQNGQEITRFTLKADTVNGGRPAERITAQEFTFFGEDGETMSVKKSGCACGG